MGFGGLLGAGPKRCAKSDRRADEPNRGEAEPTRVTMLGEICVDAGLSREHPEVRDVDGEEHRSPGVGGVPGGLSLNGLMDPSGCAVHLCLTGRRALGYTRPERRVIGRRHDLKN
jgi:hypothetical protein